MSADDKAAQRNESTSAQAPTLPAAGSFHSNFISEDDLPDWLRSIAPEESEDPGVDALLTGGTPGSEQVSVPNVTRAWTTSGDARGVDESSSLFALVASQAPQGALPQPEAVVTTRQTTSHIQHVAEPVESVDSYGSEVPPGMVTAEDIVASVMPDASAESAPATGKRFPILPLAVAGVLLLVLVAVALAMFVL